MVIHHFASKAEQQAAVEEAKEASKALERQRSMALTELHGLVARGQIVGLEVVMLMMMMMSRRRRRRAKKLARKH